MLGGAETPTAPPPLHALTAPPPPPGPTPAALAAALAAAAAALAAASKSAPLVAAAMAAAAAAAAAATEGGMMWLVAGNPVAMLAVGGVGEDDGGVASAGFDLRFFLVFFCDVSVRGASERAREEERDGTPTKQGKWAMNVFEGKSRCKHSICPRSEALVEKATRGPLSYSPQTHSSSSSSNNILKKAGARHKNK